MRSEVGLAALFDHDYRGEDEIEEFLQKIRKAAPLCFVLRRKELENYLLQPEALARAISRRIAERGATERICTKRVEELLWRITDKFEKEVSAQCLAHRLRYHERSRLDRSTVLHASLQWFESEWSRLDTRINLVPGKSVLSAINRHLQEESGIHLTHAMIVTAMGVGDIPGDLREILEAFDHFANA